MGNQVFVNGYIDLVFGEEEYNAQVFQKYPFSKSEYNKQTLIKYPFNHNDGFINCFSKLIPGYESTTVSFANSFYYEEEEEIINWQKSFEDLISKLKIMSATLTIEMELLDIYTYIYVCRDCTNVDNNQKREWVLSECKYSYESETKVQF